MKVMKIMKMNGLISAAVLSALVSSFSFADDSADEANDLFRNATEVSATANPAVIERTTETAKKLKVTLPVQFTYKVCTQTAQREVFGRDPSCGYSTVWVWRCYGGFYPAPGGYPCYGPTPSCYPYPVPGYPYPGPGYPGYYPGRPYYPYPNQNCAYYPEQVMNSCNHMETYCAQYGTTSTVKPASVAIKFKKSAALVSGSEKFELSGVQKAVDSEEVEFTLKGVNTARDYDITTRDRFFGGQGITVKAKRD